MNLTLFPTPRLWEPGDGAGAPAGTAPRVETDPALPAQGFELTVADGEIRLAVADPAGERYGRQLLAQITGQTDGDLPRIRARDWPDFPVRGLMLDISRDRVPTRDTLRRYVDLMALARINQFQLYIEHTYAYPGEEEVWGGCSPVDADDIRWLDDLCARHGIELVPNQNTFGHLNGWLRTERHRHRAEAPEGWTLGKQHIPAAVLEPTAENAAFVRRLLDELLPLFRSRSVNIGADETFELGKGASGERVAREGLGRVYLDFVLSVAGPFLAEGYQVQFWADVVASHPELLGELPPNTMPVVWMYEGRASLLRAAHPHQRIEDLGAELDMSVEEQVGGFASRARPLIEAGVPFWVAPGTSTWQSIVGRRGNARENMLDAASVGVANGCGGYLTTIWGDNGMIEPPVVTYEPLLFAGAASWNAATPIDLDLGPVLSRWVYQDVTGELAAALAGLSSLWDTLGVPSLNSSPLFEALMPQLNTVADLATADQSGVEAAIATIDEHLSGVDRATPTADDAAVLLREVRHAARLARFAACELRTQPGDPATRLAQLEELLAEQAECWLLRARPGGLDRSLAHFEPKRWQLGGRP